jgi:hypothetical protein
MVPQLTLALAPAMALAVAAVVGVPVYFAGRTESLVWGAASALTAMVFATVWPLVRRIVLGAYVAVSLVTLTLWLAELPRREPALGVDVGQRLASLVQEGDRVVVVGLWQLEIEHGIARAKLKSESAGPGQVRVRTVPASQARHPGWLDRQAVLSPSLLEEARALDVESRENDIRIWLVWSPALPMEKYFMPAFSGWHRHRVFRSTVIAVDLLLPR